MTAALVTRDLRVTREQATPLELDLASGGRVDISLAEDETSRYVLEVLATLRPPVTGRLEIAGTDAVTDPESARRHAVLLSTRSGPAGRETCAEYVRRVAVARLRPSRHAAARVVADVCTRAGVPPTRLAADLSASERHRLGRAAALAARPALLIVDEIETDGLDGAALRTWEAETQEWGGAVLRGVAARAAVGPRRHRCGGAGPARAVEAGVTEARPRRRMRVGPRTWPAGKPALVAWHLAVFVRQPAYFVAMALHATILAVFLILWGDGVPLMAGEDALAQQQVVQCVFLGLALPWAALRCRTHHAAHEDAVLACVAAIPRGSVVLGRAVATWLALMLLVATGLPLPVLAQQMAAAPIGALPPGGWALAGVAALATAATTARPPGPVDAVHAWVRASTLTTGTVAVASWLFTTTLWPLVVWGVALALLFVRLQQSAAWPYLAEEAA